MEESFCDRRVPPKLKGKIYQAAVRPAMMYGLKTLAMTGKQELELETAEMCMLRFALSVTRLDKIKNERIRGTAHTNKLSDKIREARLQWFRHVQRRNEEYLGKRMLEMPLPGTRGKG